jgi:RES domain-containing protein
LLEIAVPDDLAIHEIRPEGDDWRQDQRLTRELGDAWLALRKTPLARVPSAIAPHTWNVLLNPGHPDAQFVRIASVSKVRYDSRLFRIGGWPGPMA